MATRKTTPASEPIAPRHLWLAGLGLAAVARREAGNAACTALTAANDLRTRATTLAADTGAVVRGSLLTLRQKIEPALGELGEAVEARFSPLFVGIGRHGAGLHVVLRRGDAQRQRGKLAMRSGQFILRARRDGQTHPGYME